MAELDLTQMREDIDTLEGSKAETSHTHNMSDISSEALGPFEQKLTEHEHKLSLLEESKAETSHTHNMSDISSEVLGSLEQKLTEHEYKLSLLEGNISGSKIFFFGWTDKNSNTIANTITILIPVFAHGKTVVNVSGSAKISFICNGQWIHETIDPTTFKDVLLVNEGTMVYVTYTATSFNHDGYTPILGYITGLNISFS